MVCNGNPVDVGVPVGMFFSHWGYLKCHFLVVFERGSREATGNPRSDVANDWATTRNSSSLIVLSPSASAASSTFFTVSLQPSTLHSMSVTQSAL